MHHPGIRLGRGIHPAHEDHRRGGWGRANYVAAEPGCLSASGVSERGVLIARRASGADCCGAAAGCGNAAGTWHCTTPIPGPAGLRARRICSFVGLIPTPFDYLCFLVRRPAKPGAAQEKEIWVRQSRPHTPTKRNLGAAKPPPNPHQVVVRPTPKRYSSRRVVSPVAGGVLWLGAAVWPAASASIRSTTLRSCVFSWARPLTIVS